MKNEMSFDKGSYVVLPTPFKNNEIDYNSLKRLIIKILNSSTTGFVILGTTSETPTLSIQEKKNIIDFVSFVRKTKKLIIGVGGNDTLKTLEFAKYCCDKCDGLLVTVPNYNKPTQEGIYRHFSMIVSCLQIINTPIMLYNVPSRCGVNMKPETIKRLFNNHDNIVAIKEASGSMSQVIKIKSLCKIQIFSGDDYLVIPIMSIGGCGVVSVTGNIFPNEMENIVKYYLNGEHEKSKKLFFCMDKLIENLFIETNPGPLKQILNELKIFDRNQLRLPLCPITLKNKDKLKDSLSYSWNKLGYS